MPDTNAIPSDTSPFEETQDKTQAEKERTNRKKMLFFTEENMIRDIRDSLSKDAFRETGQTGFVVPNIAYPDRNFKQKASAIIPDYDKKREMSGKMLVFS